MGKDTVKSSLGWAWIAQSHLGAMKKMSNLTLHWTLSAFSGGTQARGWRRDSRAASQWVPGPEEGQRVFRRWGRAPGPGPQAEPQALSPEHQESSVGSHQPLLPVGYWLQDQSSARSPWKVSMNPAMERGARIQERGRAASSSRVPTTIPATLAHLLLLCHSNTNSIPTELLRVRWPWWHSPIWFYKPCKLFFTYVCFYII